VAVLPDFQNLCSWDAARPRRNDRAGAQIAWTGGRASVPLCCAHQQWKQISHIADTARKRGGHSQLPDAKSAASAARLTRKPTGAFGGHRADPGDASSNVI